jgi:hypothetical protein
MVFRVAVAAGAHQVRTSTLVVRGRVLLRNRDWLLRRGVGVGCRQQRTEPGGEERIMARVKIEDVIDHLSSEMTKALEEAVENTLPDVEFDSRELFRAFLRAVSRKCNTWEAVPDRLVEAK